MFITPYKYSYCTENFGPKGEKQFKDMTSKLEMWLQSRTNANNLNVDIISADDRHSQQTAFRLLMHFNKVCFDQNKLQLALIIENML